MPHLSGPRRYFFHHSYKVLSLQNCPSLAGKTGGTRIEKYRSLIMPLVRKCKEQHALAHLYKPSCSALILAFALRTLTPNRHIPFISTPQTSFHFGRNSKTLSLQADLFGVAISWKRNDKLFLRPHHNYSLFIIN